MQGWHNGKELIYYRPIFQLTNLAFLRAKAIPREKKNNDVNFVETQTVHLHDH